jgi:hypothetical protein
MFQPLLPSGRSWRHLLQARYFNGSAASRGFASPRYYTFRSVSMMESGDSWLSSSGVSICRLRSTIRRYNNQRIKQCLRSNSRNLLLVHQSLMAMIITVVTTPTTVETGLIKATVSAGLEDVGRTEIFGAMATEAPIDVGVAENSVVVVNEERI